MAENVKQPTKETLEKKEKVKELAWSSPARPFKSRDKKYFTTIAVVVLVLGLILLMVREFLLIGVIISLGFVSYVLATVKPEKVNHEINEDGVKVGTEQFMWDALTNFFFTEQWGYKILNIGTKKAIPGRIMMLLGSQSRDDVEKELKKRLEKATAPQKGLGEKALEKAGSLLKLE
ncbi:MAG: hypothetical protein ABH814_02475 [bacterium]